MSIPLPPETLRNSEKRCDIPSNTPNIITISLFSIRRCPKQKMYLNDIEKWFDEKSFHQESSLSNNRTILLKEISCRSHLLFDPPPPINVPLDPSRSPSFEYSFAKRWIRKTNRSTVALWKIYEDNPERDRIHITPYFSNFDFDSTRTLCFLGWGEKEGDDGKKMRRKKNPLIRGDNF